MATMVTTSGKATRGEHTKSAIVDAALDLFEEVGYEATTMRAIAQRAGCPSAMPTTTSTRRSS